MITKEIKGLEGGGVRIDFLCEVICYTCILKGVVEQQLKTYLTCN